jgi:mono/diheme cytochrome c family protein
MTFTRVLGISILFALTAVAGQSADQGVQFNRDIRPIFSDKCFACHGFDPKTRKAGLRLDTLEGATAANAEGEKAITPGDVSKSSTWKRITSTDSEEVMPPPKSHKTLSSAEKDLIKRWIEQGAHYQQHWSFEGIKKPALPAAGQKNPIDAFVLAELAKRKLTPQPEAPKGMLVRRVSFALTGLPPTPAETSAYVDDASPDAYEKMVDRFLASPRFGEEMARHWLDVARYADTHGLHLDNERQMWAYRDWVVKAFNENKKFDTFTIEQLAGDLLPNPTQDQLTATGFNRCNVTTSEGGSIEVEFVFRYAVDRTSTTAQAWMGLTAGCAVCHDHKFDPISAKEFYSLYAFFHSSADPAMDGNKLLTDPVLKLITPEQTKKLAEFDEQIKAKDKALDELTATLEYSDPATLDPKPQVEERDTVWLDDDFPAGAKVRSGGQPTQWITADNGQPVNTGKRALKRSDPGLAQDFYEEGAALLQLPQEAEFFVHVFLDPKDPPKAVMLQFNKGGWNHRAVWGDYQAIGWGKENTTERVHAGALPDASKWVRLEIPASKLGLNPGDKINGFALTQTGGTVYWDTMGVSGRVDPASDPSHSFAAWWKSKTGKDTQGAPTEINKFLKEGPDKPRKDNEKKQLRDYYLRNVCESTKAKLAAPASELEKLKKERDDYDKTIPSTFIYKDMAKPRDSFVMERGAYDKPGAKVVPDTPAFLPPLKKTGERATRLDLANWLMTPEHPLTARVAVNRLWQQFFGVGLVKTSGDFGSQGEAPSNPELLDYLATSFREGGWDVKALVKLMLTSSAFKQSPRVTAAVLQRDPENRFLARGPRFRLDAEQIRDNALFVGGLIDFEMGGKGVKPYQPPNIWEPVGFAGSNTRNYKQDRGSALYRRSLYTFFKRTAPAPFLSNFDAPNREQICVMRERSNTPLQALQLMNDVQHIEAARAFAQRMLTEGGTTPTERIQFAFATVLSRKPDGDEIDILNQQLQTALNRYSKDADAAKKLIANGESKPKPELNPAELAAYTMVANTILNLDETLNRN